MNDSIKITLVANAGVLVEHNGLGFLVDGIHHEEGHPFSPVSELDMHHMRQGAPPFAHLDYLLFTHEHPDHFTPRQVVEHLRHRSVKGLFLPDEKQGSPDLARLFEHVRERDIPYRTLGLEPGKTARFALADDLSITAIGTRHMGPQYETIRNDCYLLALNGMNLLFTGDADHVAGYFENALAGVRVDIAFVNPIFYHHPNGQHIINEIFRPREVVIYHMPFAQDDTMQFSYMVNRDMQKHGHSGIRAHVLSREKQQLCFFASASE